MNQQTLETKISKISKTKSILTTAEILNMGATHDQINYWVNSGFLYPSAEGIYMPEDASFYERHTEVEVAARFPHVVICLSHALNFHDLTSERAIVAWIAYLRKTKKPVEPKLPIRTIMLPKLDFEQGIETHIIEGIPVKVYSVAKTIADCFVYQHLVGDDVSIEAFEQAIREERCTVKQIIKHTEKRKMSDFSRHYFNKCVSKYQGTAAR